ncbi:major facilitator superfamily domain-containing protein [Blastocladiella britannica]|nr:major facilitator superfamily domain-containing protein [Blastocladiella britannica]
MVPQAPGSPRHRSPSAHDRNSCASLAALEPSGVATAAAASSSSASVSPPRARVSLPPLALFSDAGSPSSAVAAEHGTNLRHVPSPPLSGGGGTGGGGSARYADDRQELLSDPDDHVPFSPTGTLPQLDLLAPAHVVAAAPRIAQTLLRWQRITLLTLISVYTGFYFCRTNLSVALPTVLHATGLTKRDFGGVISYGYAFYAMGKLANGLLIDRIGGRTVLIACLVGSIICTFAFGSMSDKGSSIALFTLIWSTNRIFQSGGWPALTTLVRNWFPPAQHGKIMGMASLSYSLGDAIIRLFLGSLISRGITWQGLFNVSGICGILLLLPAFFFLYGSSVELDLPNVTTHVPEPIELKRTGGASKSDQAGTYAAVSSHSPTRESPQARSAPSPTIVIARSLAPNRSKSILHQPKYYLILLQSPLYTWTREIFNSWAVVYLHESYRVSEGTSSVLTLVFPLLAAVSSVGGGFLIDRVERTRRGAVYTSLVLGAALAMSLLAVVAARHDHDTGGGNSGPTHQEPAGGTGVTPGVLGAVALMGTAALFATAPASWAEGIFVLELADSHNAGIVVASAHCAGYIGAISAGSFVGTVVEASGWGRLFAMMSLAAVVNAVLACVYWWFDARQLGMEMAERDAHKASISRRRTRAGGVGRGRGYIKVEKDT